MEFLLAGLVLCFVLLAEILRRKRIVDPVFARKILHIGAISVSAVSIYFIDGSVLIWIVGSAVPVLAVAVGLGFFKNHKTGQKSYGILYFALSFFALVVLFGEDRPHLVFYPLMILAWSDGLATVFGHGFGRRKFDFSPEGKTLEGALAFFVSALIVLSTISFVPFVVPGIAWQQMIFISVFLAVLEALSIRSFDNFWVPAAVAYWLVVPWDQVEMLYAVLVPVLACFAIWRKALTSGGAFAAAILGWIFLLNPLPEILVFPSVFFLVGSLLSKLPGHEDDGSVRNANQVFANGAIPAVCFMAYFVLDEPVLLIAGISGFSFALSDTSSSEIGVRMGGKHFKILNGRAAAKGASGAITLSGLLVGLFFAFALASLALVPSFGLGLKHVAIIGLAGFLGNLADSLIGDTLQAKYASPGDSLREVPLGENDLPVSGHAWVNNSTTNLLASAMACLLGFVLANLV